MSYQSGFRHEIIIPLNRSTAKAGKFGLDSDGIEWLEGDPLHANVDYQRGKSALNAGAVDAYAVKIVRMNWTDKLNERSRVLYDGKVYQIIPETFNGHYRENTLQFLMQLVVNGEYKRKQKPYFTKLQAENNNVLAFFDGSATIIVGDSDSDSAVDVFAYEEYEGKNEYEVVRFPDVDPLNVGGCTDGHIGHNYDLRLGDICVPGGIIGLGEYSESNDFSIGRVTSCASSGEPLAEVCEICYKGKPVDGWYIIIEAPIEENDQIMRVRNYIS